MLVLFSDFFVHFYNVDEPKSVHNTAQKEEQVWNIAAHCLDPSSWKDILHIALNAVGEHSSVVSPFRIASAMENHL